jgi:DNA ligase (NAD+)
MIGEINRIKFLEEKILQAREEYYNGVPQISDVIYDNYIDELKSLDPKNVAITMVGAPVSHKNGFKKVKHNIPMNSLDKAKTPLEMTKWLLDTCDPKGSIFVIEKLDGISVELIYENGKLIQASSRGDGETGDDITANVIKMRGVNKSLHRAFSGSIRGEIVCTLYNFGKYFSGAANPRNIASGVAHRLDGEGCEHLDVLAYQIIGTIDNEPLDVSSEVMQIRLLQELEFQTPGYEACKGKSITDMVDFVIAEYEKYKTKRHELNYNIDGLVVRINDLTAQRALDADAKNLPKGSIAFKFPDQLFETTVKNIEWVAGNSGQITPICWVEPINVLGSMVQKATLHNIANINKLGIDIGATVAICKANEIIPRIEAVLKSTGSTFPAATSCPSCMGPIEMFGEHLKCVSTDTCPAQKQGRIENWINALNVLEWGPALISKLIEKNKILDISDLYSLSIDDLSLIDRMGQKSATNCYMALWDKNPISLAQFLGGLTIPGIREDSIKLLIASGLDSLEKILAASKSDFLKVSGFGSIKSECLFFGLKRNLGMINKLLANGLKIKEKTMATGKLNGKIFVITGKMSRPRKELEDIIKQNGGEVSSGVDKKTNYLIIDDTTSMTSKAVKAREFHTELLSEAQFLDMVS